MAETRQETLTRLFPAEIDAGKRPEEPIPTDWPFQLDFPQFIANDDNWYEQENAFLRQLFSNDKIMNALIEGIKDQLANCDLRIVTEVLKGLMSPDMLKKLNSIEAGALNNPHPATHSATMIAQDGAHRFVSDTEKTTWNNKANASHGQHTPAKETASNARFLRNDATWQTIIPDNIGAYTKAAIDNKVMTINNAINGKEPKFNKNNAFNKNFGTAAGTVCQGNDSRLSNARPASGGNSDTVDGLHAHGGRNNEANKLVRTNGNGYIDITHINSDQPVNNGNVANVIYDNGDGYLRKCSLAHLIAKITAGGGGGIVAENLSTNGYRKFADGYIEQWGFTTYGDQYGNNTITFPLAFPNECFVVVANTYRPNMSDATSGSNFIRSKSRTGFTFLRDGSGISWQAIGK